MGPAVQFTLPSPSSLLSYTNLWVTLPCFLKDLTPVLSLIFVVHADDLQ